MYKVKNPCSDYPNRGFVRTAQIVRGADETHCCYVEIWSHSCCGLNTLHRFDSFWQPDKDLITFLKTQPFSQLTGYNCQLFTMVPSLSGGHLKRFCDEFCEKGFTFTNHAHGNYSLELFVLDLTKHADL